MQVFDHHVIFDEINYDRQELKDWYKSFGFIEQEDGFMVYNPQK